MFRRFRAVFRSLFFVGFRGITSHLPALFVFFLGDTRLHLEAVSHEAGEFCTHPFYEGQVVPADVDVLRGVEGFDLLFDAGGVDLLVVFKAFENEAELFDLILREQREAAYLALDGDQVRVALLAPRVVHDAPGEDTREGAYTGDADDHQEDGDDASRLGVRHDVAVAGGAFRHEGEPDRVTVADMLKV